MKKTTKKHTTSAQTGTRYTDQEAKDILRDSEKWPKTTQLWPTSHDTYWIQAQPKEPGKKATTPCIRTPGQAKYTLHPDGMWLLFHTKNSSGKDILEDEFFADAIIFENCTTIQNLNDKRSRYLSASSSLLVHVEKQWLMETSGYKNKKEGKSRFLLANAFQGEKPIHDHWDLPLRFVRVVFTIPDAIYEDWSPHCVPAGHELFMPQRKLTGATAKSMREALQKISLETHFL